VHPFDRIQRLLLELSDVAVPNPSAPWYKTLTRYQWLILLVAWLGWVFDIMDTALFNFAKGPMLEEFFGGKAGYKPHSAYIEGFLLTVLLVGWSVGGLIFGALADRWGRVRTLVLTVLIYCAFTGLTAVCQTWEQVALVRFLTALGIGGEWAAGAALVAEAFPDKARAPGAAMLQSAAAFGPWFAALINFAVPARSWRLLFLVGILPAILTIFVRLGLKEPEKWQRAEAKSKGSILEPVKELFSRPRWRRHAIIALVLGVVGIAAAGNITYWLPNMVQAVSHGLSADIVQGRKSQATLAMHVGTLLGVFAMPWLCEKIGRRNALITFFVLSPISVVIASLGSTSYTSLLLLAPVMSFFTIGLSAGFVLYFPELFPTSMRATGAGFAYNTGRILAAGVPLLTGALIGASNSVTKGVAQTALVLLVGIVALLFAPETKGKGLPEEA